MGLTEAANTAPVRVLLFEDNPTDFLLVQAALEDVPGQEFHIARVERLAEGLQLLATESFDAALLDLSLPDSTGLATVERIRERVPELPLVVLTGNPDQGIIRQILARGAQDYVIKDEAAGPVLARAISYSIERHRVAVEIERRALELLASQAHIRQQAALIDAAQDAILVLDPEARIISWNKSAERIHGWTAPEAVGRNYKTLLRADPARIDEIWEELLRTGEWTGELTSRDKADRQILTDTRLTLLRDDRGAPQSVLSISTDITERRRLEHRFLRAQRLESLGSLAGGIAHDLNNVLAPIAMAVDILRERISDPPSVELLRHVADSARRGADMVRQVLTFARGVEGQRVLMQPAHLIEEVARIFRDTLLKSVDVQVHVAPDTWPILGDRTQLHQVLMNLGVNARDAMPDGGSLILSAMNMTLQENRRISPDARSGPHVLIRVTDTGCGMSADVIERIFDPFFSTKEVGKGTGLGLATVQGIVRSHGGFVTVYSEVGNGTTFNVYLPAQPAAAGQSAEAVAESFPRGNGELILIVDDEASIREITRTALEEFNYRTLLADNGAHAVEIFREHRDAVSAVLIDMMMPQLGGAASIPALKELNPGVRIVAASGLASAPQARTATLAGADAFLAKPYSIESLLQTLEKLLRERSPAPSA